MLLRQQLHRLLQALEFILIPIMGCALIGLLLLMAGVELIWPTVWNQLLKDPDDEA